MMTFGFTIARSAAVSPICSIWLRLRSSWPCNVPVGPCATMREKCTVTPAGAIAIISGSTVGLPGGTRKPSRARRSVIAALQDLREHGKGFHVPQTALIDAGFGFRVRSQVLAQAVTARKMEKIKMQQPGR